jgi:hypothetical protein
MEKHHYSLGQDGITSL